MQDSQLVRRTWGLPVMLLALLAGCNHDSGATQDATPVADNPGNPGSPGSPGSSALTIGGRPTPFAQVGVQYDFTPSVTNSANTMVTFSIQNKPTWASFNVSTGRLIGVPKSADAGTYTRILIAASAGTSSSSLPQFEITVSPGTGGGGASPPSVSLSWTAPTLNSDGTPLTNLSGYRIYYGNAPDALTQQITISSAETTQYVVDNLSAGAWYFALKAYNTMNVESNLSPVVEKTL